MLLCERFFSFTEDVLQQTELFVKNELSKYNTSYIVTSLFRFILN